MSTIHNFKHVNLTKTEGFNFNFSTPISSIPINVLINPFQIFSQVGLISDPFSNFISFCQKLYNQEAALRSSSEFNEFRNNLLLVSGYPSLKIGKADAKSSSKSTIMFIKHSAPLSLVLWFPMHFIAFDSSIRELFQHFVSNSLQIPPILQELMLRTRSSRCGKFNIIPGLDTDSIDTFIDLVAPCLKNTFLDYRYLRTPEGMHSYISFLSLISSTDYTTKVVSEVVQNILFDSSFQTTQMSISTLDNDFSTATVMQGNSYANGSPTEIHLLDAIFTTQKSFDSDLNFILTSLSSSITLTGLSMDSISSYIVKRCLGITTNSLNLHEEHYVPTPLTAPTKKLPKRNFQRNKPPVPILEQKVAYDLMNNKLLTQLLSKFDSLINALTQNSTLPLAA